MPENNQTAVAVIEQVPEAIVEWNLDNWPEDRFNRLVPTQTLGLGTDLIRPIVQVVKLDLETDTYESNDLPTGHRAPNARGLSLLADALGADFVDEVRLDDGSDPMRAYVRVYAEVIDATGRKRRAPGSRDYRLESQAMTDRQRQRAKGYVHEHAATRARHRALRAVASIPQSYPVAQLQKPFAVVRYILNMQQPEVRARVLDAMVGTVAALYGPEPAKELAAGSAVVDLPEIAEDEEPKNVTPAPETPTTLPGEKLAAAVSSDDLPDYLTGTTTAPAEAKAEVPAKAPVDVVEKLQGSAERSKLKGDITQPQKDRLKSLFVGHVSGADFASVIGSAFGDEFVASPTAAQAQAIVTLVESFGGDVDGFHEAWRAAAAAIRGEAAA